MGNSKIDWTNKVWNPVTGCHKISVGCANCYAERIHNRFSSEPFSTIVLHADRLNHPRRWRKPWMVFVCSVSDLFHKDVPENWLCDMFATMADCPQHTFQILTKRPARMLSFLKKYDDKWKNETTTIERMTYTWPLPNVWMGVSCENQAAADERIPLLLQTPAAVRFVSLEPLLGLVDLRPYLLGYHKEWDAGGDIFTEPYKEKLNWAIIGGESGPKARPCRVEWIESIIDQCRDVSVPCFVKQLGENPWWAGAKSHPINPARGKCNKPEEWPIELQIREYPSDKRG